MQYLIILVFASVVLYMSAGREGKIKRDAMMYEHEEIDFGKDKAEEVSEEIVKKGNIKIILLIFMIASWAVFLLYLLFFV